jgi:elongation factor Ts
MSDQLEILKKLREVTGAGISDCKNALKACADDMEKAIIELRKKGLATAEKKASNNTKEGIIEAYVHHDSKLGVLIELNCETDFVAKTDEFRALAKELAMQIAIDDPRYISREEVPEEAVEKEKQIFVEQLQKENKPVDIIEKILVGKIDGFYKSVCLVELPYMRDSKIMVKDMINETIGKLKENIRVKRFARFKIGED